MPSSQIAREDFVAAIETGIEADARRTVTLDAAAVEKLREYARTTKHAMRGTFYSPGYDCGCPMTGAGICNLAAELTDFGLAHVVNEGKTEWWSAFYGAFDHATRKYTNYMEVVD